MSNIDQKYEHYGTDPRISHGLLEPEMGKQLKQLRENARKSRRASGRDYPFRSSEEWIHYVLRSTNLTVSDLRREGIIFATPPLEYKYIKSGFNTPSVKIECYSEQL